MAGLPNLSYIINWWFDHILGLFFREVVPEGDNILSLIPVVAISTSGLVGSHHFFSKLDKNNIESIITTYIELYQEMYYKEFKKKKLKNIIIGSFSVPVFYVAIFFLNGGLDDLGLSPESKFSPTDSCD
tara:strand:+ start:83 stop:469 length:387 start_codon:yes stop_codon:yes gene_type:complete